MTRKTRSFRPSPAMIVACLALFVAMAGSAVASGLLAKNSVRSAQIVDGAVRNADLHDGAIGASKISPDAVTAPAIADNAVTASAIPDNTITSSKVADESLAGADIAAGNITAKQLGTVGVRTNTATVEAGKIVGVAALCNSGEKVLGGGGAPSDLNVAMISSRPQSNGWAYQAKNNSGATATVTVYAMCLAG